MPDDCASIPRIVRFGVFDVAARSGELRKAGRRVAVQEQPFRVLLALLERPGELVTRDQLRRRLWPEDTFVDFEHGLNAAIKRLRDALGDSADNPRFVETLPRRGYRFIAPVRGSDDGPDAPASVSRSRRRCGTRQRPVHRRHSTRARPGSCRAWRLRWRSYS
jgi:DNA-binding winged helix-turn-helix (wHTH) protein